MGYWNNSAIRIGSHVDSGYSNSFSGVISCLQVYNRALNVAEMDQKRDCKDARQTMTEICPPEYTLIKNMCYKVGIVVFEKLKHISYFAKKLLLVM